MFLLMCGIASAETIQSARGFVEINDKDTYIGNSFWTGTIENLDDVTFKNVNFSRPTPHTVVFVNCTNLTFIDCNLNNVELQADFTVQGSLTIHQREYELLGKNYREIECGDNKTRTYEISEIEDTEGQLTLTNTKDTPNDKKIKAIRIHPNTGLPK